MWGLCTFFTSFSLNQTVIQKTEMLKLPWTTPNNQVLTFKIISTTCVSFILLLTFYINTDKGQEIKPRPNWNFLVNFGNAAQHYENLLWDRVVIRVLSLLSVTQVPFLAYGSTVIFCLALCKLMDLCIIPYEINDSTFHGLHQQNNAKKAQQQFHSSNFLDFIWIKLCSRRTCCNIRGIDTPAA